MPDKRAALYTSRVNLSKVERRLLHVMNKDVLRMMEVVHGGTLTKPDQEAVTRYLKLIKELKSNEEAKAQDVSEEVLVKTAQD